MTGKLIAAAASVSMAVATLLMLTALPQSEAHAAKAPYVGCVAVTRQEYDSARRQHLLRTRYSQYMRTGLPGRRQYWYCR
jgi:hypothetical protein